MKFLSLLLLTLLLCGTATPAHADPISAAIVGALGLAAGGIGATIVGAAVNTAIAFGLSFAARALAGKPKPPGSSYGGVKATIAGGGVVPRSFIHGRFATSGSLTYVGTWGYDTDPVGETRQKYPNAYLVQVIALSDLPVVGMVGLFVNGEQVTFDPNEPYYVEGDETVGITIPEYTSNGERHLWVRFHNGNQTTPDSYLRSVFGDDPDRPYTADMVGHGIAYAVVTSLIDPELFTGIPKFKFVLDGIKVYDITEDSSVGGSGTQRFATPSTHQFSKNPAVLIYNILRGISYNGKWAFGAQNVAASRLPFSAWAAAINECDIATAKLGGGTEAQYEAGGEIPYDAQPADIIEELLTACNGRLAEVGGIYKPHVGAANPAVFSFTDGNIISTEQQSFSPFYGIGESINGMTARYVAPGEGWGWKDAPPRYRTDLEAEDGNRRLLANVEYGRVTSGTQAQRLMKSAIAEARRARRHTIALPPEAFVLEPMDYIAWDSDRNGYIAKLFRVDGIRDQADLNIVVDITEVDPSDYNWTPSSDELPTTDGSIIIRRPPAQPMFNWLATGTQIDGRAAIQLSWDVNVRDVNGVFFEIRKPGQAALILHGLTDRWDIGTIILSHNIAAATDYEVRGKYRPISNRSTIWSSWLAVTTPPGNPWDNTSGDFIPPGVPTNFTFTSVLVTASNGQQTIVLKADWDAPADLDVAAYNIEVKEGAGNYIGFTTHTTDWEYRGVRAGIQYTARVRAFDLRSNFGAFTSPITITAAADTIPPATPTGFTPHGGFNTIWLKWNANAETDLARYDIYESTTTTAPTSGTSPTFTAGAGSTTAIRADLASEVTRHYWIRAVDTSGNKSAWSARVQATTLGAPPTTVSPASIDMTHFAQGLEPIGIVDTLPVVAGYNGPSTILYTIDGKIYRLVDDEWTAVVDGADIEANTITGGAIIAGGIGADQIAANAITTKHLTIGDFTNLVPDPQFKSGDFSRWGSVTVGPWSVLARGSTGTNAGDTAPTAFYGRADSDASTRWIYATTEYVECQPGDQFYIAFDGAWETLVGPNDNFRIFIQWVSSSNSITFSSSVYMNNGSGNWANYSSTVTAPANARGARLRVQRDLMATPNASKAAFTNILMRRIVPGVQIADGAVTAAKVSAGTLQALNADISTAWITNANIVSIDAVKITTGFLNAARIEAASIGSGKILISGSTTLADWRSGSDTTKIDGGNISANSIAANKLEIGSRNATAEGIEFEHNAPGLNQLSWTGGQIKFVPNSGGPIRNVVVSAGSTPAVTVGQANYIYWAKGATDPVDGSSAVLSRTTLEATAFATNNLILAVYRGGTDLVANYGRTIIDGSNIKTDTITANRIKSRTISAEKIILNGVETEVIANNAITQSATNQAVWDPTVTHIIVDSPGKLMNSISLTTVGGRVTLTGIVLTNADIANTGTYLMVFTRNGIVVKAVEIYCTETWTTSVGMEVDVPAAGTHTFALRVARLTGSIDNALAFQNSFLHGIETKK